MQESSTNGGIVPHMAWQIIPVSEHIQENPDLLWIFLLWGFCLWVFCRRVSFCHVEFEFIMEFPRDAST